MDKKRTVCWHGIGPREPMLAASRLAEVMALAGKSVQASPQPGMRHQVSPQKAFNRISDSPIRSHAEINQADIEVVISPCLLQSIDFKTGVKDDAIIVVNTPLEPAAIKEKLNLKTNRLLTLDAGSHPSPHISLMTAVIHCLGIISIEDYKKCLEGSSSQQAGVNGSGALSGMLKVVDQALAEIKEDG